MQYYNYTYGEINIPLAQLYNSNTQATICVVFQLQKLYMHIMYIILPPRPPLHKLQCMHSVYVSLL